MTISNPEVSQYVLSTTAQKSDDHGLITCVRKGNGESVAVTSFISKDGHLHCRVTGNKSEWASVKNHRGEDLVFEKSWKFSPIELQENLTLQSCMMIITMHFCGLQTLFGLV